MWYIPNDSHNPYYNLALEEYVLKNLDQQESYILLWQNEPSVIIGRFQNTIEEINQEYVTEQKINVVRRITGGGAVYHDLGNLNFSFIVPAGDRVIDFRKFTEPVVKALAKMGIQAEHTGRNDITIQDKKFSGNAQYSYQNRTLHHGTILFSSNLEEVQKTLNVKADKIESKGVKSVRSRVTNVSAYLEQECSVAEFRDLLLVHLFDGKTVKEYKLSPADLANVQKLMEDKYLTWEWNFGHSPAFNLTKSGRFSCGGIEVRLQVRKGVIEGCKIYGDFFSNQDISQLEDKIKGVKYKEEDLQDLLGSVDLSPYFNGLSQDEFIQLLVR